MSNQSYLVERGVDDDVTGHGIGRHLPGHLAAPLHSRVGDRGVVYRYTYQ